MKITLKELKNYFKENFDWQDRISIGKIDNNQEKAVCFYNSKRQLSYQSFFGGKAKSSTYIKPITILLRYTKNQNSAEVMAQKIFEFFEERTFFIEGKRIFVQMYVNEPINLGTDENSIYEYSFELDFHIER